MDTTETTLGNQNCAILKIINIYSGPWNWVESTVVSTQILKEEEESRILRHEASRRSSSWHARGYKETELICFARRTSSIDEGSCLPVRLVLNLDSATTGYLVTRPASRSKRRSLSLPHERARPGKGGRRRVWSSQSCAAGV